MQIHQILDSLRRDVIYALRGLQRSPGFTFTVVVMLALGIGANTAIFSLVDRLLIRPLPYPENRQLVMLYESFRSTRNNVSMSNWLDWQRMNKSFDTLAAWNTVSETFTGGGEPELVAGQTVSFEFFPALKIAPSLGRAFTAEEDQPGAAPVVILSDRFWKRRFDSDPSIIGKKIELDSTFREVVGVMPPGFYFGNPATEYWTPYRMDRTRDSRIARNIPSILGRLKPGATIVSAQAEMQAIAARLEESYPSSNKYASVSIFPLQTILTDEVRPSLLVLLATVTGLLVVACFNVASMMLARSAARRREMAVRVSLGASRGAIFRQLMVESLLLAVVGGAAGFLVALWGISALLEISPRNLIRVPEVPPDRWVLMYTALVSVLTGLTFGLAPAIATTRRSLAEHLHGLGRSIAKSARLRQGLVVAQVTLTAILLCASGLLVRSFTALKSVPTGVNAGDVLTMQITMPAARYDRNQQVEFVTSVIRRLEALPGVLSAGATRSLPVIGPTAGTRVEFKGTPETSPMDSPSTRVRMATPGYFKTVAIPIVQGREFTWDDQRPNTEPVFIVNEAFVRAHLKGRDPLSTSMRVFMAQDNPFGAIVGVAADVLEGSLRGEITPTVFYNQRQLTYTGMTLFVRTNRPDSLSTEAVRVIHDLDRNLAVTQVRPLEEAFSLSIARERLNAIVSAFFGITALLLASFGLYGLLAFLVAERTREIGIRMALGAEASNVLRMVMRRGLLLVGLGIAAGLAGAFGVSRFIQALLFGVQSYDLATFAAATFLLIIVSAAAAYVPARRATRVDPIVALREE